MPRKGYRVPAARQRGSPQSPSVGRTWPYHHPAQVPHVKFCLRRLHVFASPSPSVGRGPDRAAAPAPRRRLAAAARRPDTSHLASRLERGPGSSGLHGTSPRAPPATAQPQGRPADAPSATPQPPGRGERGGPPPSLWGFPPSMSGPLTRPPCASRPGRQHSAPGEPNGPVPPMVLHQRAFPRGVGRSGIALTLPLSTHHGAGRGSGERTAKPTSKTGQRVDSLVDAVAGEGRTLRGGRPEDTVSGDDGGAHRSGQRQATSPSVAPSRPTTG